MAAFGAKAGTGGRRRFPFSGLAVVSVLMSVGVLHDGSLIRSPLLGAIRAVVFTSGIALAIWARVHLRRNWGMPMTQGAEPELVTSGPYEFVRPRSTPDSSPPLLEAMLFHAGVIYAQPRKRHWNKSTDRLPHWAAVPPPLRTTLGG